LISGLLFFCFVKEEYGCAFFEESDITDESVFTPEIIHQPANAPFFASYHLYYGMDNYVVPQDSPTVDQVNTCEWMNYFNHHLDTSDITWLIYKSSLVQLKMIKMKLENRSIELDNDAGFYFPKLEKEKNMIAVVNYLILARQAEQLFNVDYNDWEPISYDSILSDSLATLFRKGFEEEKNKFLKDRYGFQTARSLCLAGKKQDCIHFVDVIFKPSVNAQSMYYRTLGYKARALYKLKNYSEANYIFSYLFDHDPTARYTYFSSFHPQEESDWLATLQLAKTNREKEVLWQLLGIYADPLRGMKEIYSINPKSELLPLLLMRSVNLLESRFLTNPIRYGTFYGQDQYSMSEYSSLYGADKMDSTSLEPFIVFSKTVISENIANRLNAWQLSAAYACLFANDLEECSTILSKINAGPDHLIAGQAEIIRGLLEVKKVLYEKSVIDENAIYNQIQKILSYKDTALRKVSAVRYMLTLLSHHYNSKSEMLKRELCYPRGNEFYFSSDDVQHMIDFRNRNDLNALERYLVSSYPLSLYDLHEIKAVGFIYAYDFTNAVHEFDMAKPAMGDALYGNPFTIHIVDCHDCDFIAPQKVTYYKSSFATKMVELKAKGDTATENSERAMNYFLYANGLYNMTWYGNGRTIYETKIRYVEPDDYDNGTSNAPKAFFDCSQALEYYKKAMELTSNKEFKAKCAWMCAKCEHNLWLESPSNSDGDFAAGDYFNKMKLEYSDTKYYQEVIKECGYFCTFITGGSKTCIKVKESEDEK